MSSRTTPFIGLRSGTIAAIWIVSSTPHKLSAPNVVTNNYERCAPRFLRKRALDFIDSHIDGEDMQTNYEVHIGPVNKAINMLCVWHAHGPDGAV